jgi:hypothetical protein
MRWCVHLPVRRAMMHAVPCTRYPTRDNHRSILHGPISVGACMQHYFLIRRASAYDWCAWIGRASQPPWLLRTFRIASASKRTCTVTFWTCVCWPLNSHSSDILHTLFENGFLCYFFDLVSEGPCLLSPPPTYRISTPPFIDHRNLCNVK